MIIIKWQKDETEEFPFYNLYAYIDNYKFLIGYIGWDSFRKHWHLGYHIPPIQKKCISYKYYDITEVNDVLFKAVLDIQSELSRINNMCVDYCNALSDYIIDYIQGIEHNEN